MTIVTRAAKGSALTYAEVDGNFTTPVTIGSTAIQLGATSTTLAGLTSVTLTQDPTNALQVATKQYVDAVAEGLHVHAACACATTGTLASITGGTVTYNNGTAGVGATLTLSVALTTLDSYTLQNGDRILVKNEATQANNGIYTWATGGTVLTRATDFDTATEIASGDFTFVTYGSTYANSGWVQTTVMVTVGTTPVTFVQFAGAGTYTAGTGLTLTGTQFSLTAPVTAALGGTGQTSYANGDLLYASASTTLSKLGIGVANLVLTSSGTAPQWSNTLSLTGLTVTNDVTISGLKIGRGTNGYTTNTVVGRSAFGSATAGQYNTVFGLSALAASTGSYNIAIGASSMETASGGDNNVGVGNSTLKVTTSGGLNSAFGTEALNAVTSGSSNVAVGERAGVTIGSIFAVTTGSNNTFIGTRAGFASATQRNYATAIGANAQVDSDNTVVLGRTTDAVVVGATSVNASTFQKLQVTGGIDVISGQLGIGITGLPVASVDIVGDYNTRNGGYVSDSTQVYLQQSGDVFGTTRLTMQNRNGSNGALFNNFGVPLVDFGFQGSTGPQGNLRYEGRSGSWLNPANTNGELQWLDDSTGAVTIVMGIGLGGLQMNNLPVSASLFLNQTTISSSQTIPAGNNAMAVGPITVNNNVSVAVSDNQRWVIL